MSVFRNLLINIKDKRLPSEYQEVEYIQSSGSQYINTGISGNAIGEYEIKLDGLGGVAHAYEQYFSGTRNNGNNTGKLFNLNSQVVYGGYPSSVAIPLGSDNAILEIKVFSNTGITCNGEFKNSFGSVSWGDMPFWVFNSSGEPTLGASMRLYYLKMYSDGVISRDFIPCYRKSDNVVGLYDLVSKNFFTNDGTGTFIKGNDI